MSLLTRGNAKLGRHVWHFNLPAGTSCPGASEWCRAHCYASKGRYMLPSVVDKYAANWAAASDPDALERELSAELAALPTGSVVRIHTSGDFHTGAYVAMWRHLAAATPSTQFYAYTRSWRVAALVTELDRLRALPNVTLWASTDETTGPGPVDWPEATIGFRSGYASCPEQTGRRKSCSDCGLCWHHNLRSNARLAFRAH